MRKTTLRATNAYARFRFPTAAGGGYHLGRRRLEMMITQAIKRPMRGAPILNRSRFSGAFGLLWKNVKRLVYMERLTNPLACSRPNPRTKQKT